MGAVKMNITLPAKVAKTLKQKAKPRERSALIAEALELYFEKQMKKNVMEDLIEAYKLSAAELNEEDSEWLNAKLTSSNED